MLEFHQVHKTYTTPQGPLNVLNDVSLRLAAGESLALMGESGSGKSTLLHLAAGLDLPDQGTVSFENQNVASLPEPTRAKLRREQLGLVFQQFHLVPSLTVIDNLRLQARLAKRDNVAWTDHLIERLGLHGMEKRYPEQLSGGQQQRLAIGRALAPRPPLLLADEPTGNLDETTAGEVLELLLSLVRETQCALLIVTHSPQVAAPLDRCLRLSHGHLLEAAL
ncbi:ABC transporter ATP-binding protein [Vreelandella titanicae]|jgi:putative ABC transport system ATP-binding protein|uniref:ABC transporter ATP-binding protein n=1 Tax=Vreelandella titanicae TaxID=664683 RepID=UPI000346F2DC|nr:ABC transporter ATP-binding protein [Halomonas titanicae]MCE7519444.1 ABC transporter ATP-binding protein [Halomonas titanicae]NVE92161.1 ABC transporter ATP-binding protein [Halomonas titanicae]|tara:strand:+ start:1026 stop:1691 length:666 start_codon:yes stop_codon:yes gene_type:complete